MSTEDTRKVVSRAVLDEEFRKTLYGDPNKALEGYDLSPEEIQALRAVPAETIDEFANSLEERISMAVVAFGIDSMGGDAAGGNYFGGKAAGADASGADYYGGRAAGADAAGADYYGGRAAGADASGADYYGRRRFWYTRLGR